ncbi:hypothetical protein [Nonomuraea dietziae]|uniref:hypothetical protein n=1 Tax=Nonomuraea dietziae TaxID=65515 RepID=UPI003442CF32
MDPITIAIVLVVLTVATKTGRNAVSNAVRSGHRATGWRTPRKALEHHAGRAGAWVGRTGAKKLRDGRSGIAGWAIKRWQQRLANGHKPVPLIGPHRPDEPPASTAQADITAAAPDHPTEASTPTNPQPTTTGAPAADQPRKSDIGPDRSDPAPPATPPADPGPGPTVVRPVSIRRPALSKGKNAVARLLLNIEPPTTDAEFLEDCRAMADGLRMLADEIGNWAEGVAGLGLPASITEPLAAIGEGLNEAATGALRAATRFEEEFEEAREVAARGMTITGQDAA